MRTLNVSKNTKSISTKMALNNSQKLLAGALAFVLVAGMTSPAFAFNIDTFDVGMTSLEADQGMGTDFSTVAADPNHVIGGERYTSATYVSGPGLATVVMADTLDVPPKIMGFSSSTGVVGEFNLRYDADGAGLGEFDITQQGTCNSIEVTMTSADLASGISVWLTDSDTDGSSLEFPIIAAGPQIVDFPFAQFTNQANIDFDSIEKIEVRVDGVANGDYQIDLINCPQTPVGGTVGSMSTATLLVAGAQANMGLWSLALVGAVGASAAIVYKKKSKKTEQ